MLILSGGVIRIRVRYVFSDRRAHPRREEFFDKLAGRQLAIRGLGRQTTVLGPERRVST